MTHVFNPSAILNFLLLINISISIKRKTDGSENEDQNAFGKIIGSRTFIDKTLFVKAYVESECATQNKVTIITAPSGFGKSTNLNMLEHFLEIQVDQSGNPKTKSNYRNEPIRDTDNYRLFVQNKLKIVTEYPNITELHFGKYPVISLSLNISDEVDITTVEQADELFNSALRRCFTKHKYLLRSNVLNETEKTRLVATHSGTGKDPGNLEFLIECLYKHFSEQPIVLLVDNYDSMIANIMFRSDDRSLLDSVTEISIATIFRAINDRNRIGMAVLSGVSSYGLEDERKANESVCRYPFLLKHEFVNFYGLIDDEFRKLLNDPSFGLDERSKTAPITEFAGYKRADERNIYNFRWAVNFLNSEGGKKCPPGTTAAPSWNPIKGLTRMLAVQYIRTKVEMLLEGKTVAITMWKNILITANDIAGLRNLSVSSTRDYSLINIFFFLLWQHGYLSYDPLTRTDNLIDFRVPNGFVKNRLFDSVHRYFAVTCKVDQQLVDSCRGFFNAIVDHFEGNNESDTLLVKSLKEFRRNLQLIVRDFSGGELTAKRMYDLMFYIICRCRYVFYTKTADYNDRTDILMTYKQSLAIMLHVKYKDSAENAMKEILVKKLYNMMFKKKSILQGREKTFFIALNVDQNRTLSISYLIDSKSIDEIKYLD